MNMEENNIPPIIINVDSTGGDVSKIAEYLDIAGDELRKPKKKYATIGGIAAMAVLRAENIIKNKLLPLEGKNIEEAKALCANIDKELTKSYQEAQENSYRTQLNFAGYDEVQINGIIQAYNEHYCTVMQFQDYVNAMIKMKNSGGIKIEAPTIANIQRAMGSYSKPKKPNTGFKLGSYRFKSGKK